MSPAGAILFPRVGGKFVAEHTKDVYISLDGINETATKIFKILKNKETVLAVDRWKLHELLPQTQDEAAVNWVFLLDVLNFSFWSKPGHAYMVRFGGKEWKGYWSMCAAICRAVNDGIDITNPHKYSRITRQELEHVFRSDSEFPMPMMEERLIGLHKAGQVLLQKYDGSFANLVRSSDGSAVELLRRIVQDFETFRDEAKFEGQTIGFYKRAQILVADTWACCGGRGLGTFSDIDSITTFADYRIPQALVWFGAVSYSEDLLKQLNNDHRFTFGDRLEIEIRGCTIWAIELIVEALKKMIHSDLELPNDTQMNSIIVDHFIWDYRSEHDSEMNDIPFHKVRCIYY